jgi:hypothetical protein
MPDFALAIRPCGNVTAQNTARDRPDHRMVMDEMAGDRADGRALQAALRLGAGPTRQEQ